MAGRQAGRQAWRRGSGLPAVCGKGEPQWGGRWEADAVVPGGEERGGAALHEGVPKAGEVGPEWQHSRTQPSPQPKDIGTIVGPFSQKVKLSHTLTQGHRAGK